MGNKSIIAITVITVAIVVIFTTLYITKSFGSETNNARTNHVSANVTSCKCVIFRLDDIQDYYEHDQSLALMDTFAKYNQSFTAGIIAHDLGNDTELVSHLTNLKSFMGAKMEIANHGWKHEHFRTFSLQNQTKLMSLTDAKLQSMFHVNVDTFIAPYNELNNNTLIAMSNNNLHIVSADVGDDTYYGKDSSGILHMPIYANMSDWNSGTGKWDSPHTVFTLKSDIDTMIKAHGFAVVMMHPHDDVQTLDRLLEQLVIEHYKIVTFTQYAELTKS